MAIIAEIVPAQTGLIRGDCQSANERDADYFLIASFLLKSISVYQSNRLRHPRVPQVQTFTMHIKRRMQTYEVLYTPQSRRVSFVYIVDALVLIKEPNSCLNIDICQKRSVAGTNGLSPGKLRPTCRRDQISLRPSGIPHH